MSLPQVKRLTSYDQQVMITALYKRLEDEKGTQKFATEDEYLAWKKRAGK